MGDNKFDIYNRSYDFSLRLVQTAKGVKIDHINRSIISQLVKSGTSISANLAEADVAATRKDFINKLSISIKEAKETLYWLKLLYDSQYINEKSFKTLFTECGELTKILSSIKIKSQKSAIV